MLRHLKVQVIIADVQLPNVCKLPLVMFCLCEDASVAVVGDF